MPTEPDSAIMQAIINGTVLAESDDIVKVDGNPYFPREAMNTEFFRVSSHSTVCGWKGKARYWDVVVGDQVITNAVGLMTLRSQRLNPSVSALPSIEIKV